jgi:hypothetical protein
MPQNNHDEACHEVRQEIIRLLHAQMHALQRLSALSDVELVACYQRQERVSELRDQLSIALNSEAAPIPDRGDVASAPIASPTSALATQAVASM